MKSQPAVCVSFLKPRKSSQKLPLRCFFTDFWVTSKPWQSILAEMHSRTSGLSDYLAVDEVVTLTYTVEVDDHHGGVTSQDIVVTVNGSNDAPDIADIAQQGLVEQTDSGEEDGATLLVLGTASGRAGLLALALPRVDAALPGSLQVGALERLTPFGVTLSRLVLVDPGGAEVVRLERVHPRRGTQRGEPHRVSHRAPEAAILEHVRVVLEPHERPTQPRHPEIVQVQRLPNRPAEGEKRHEQDRGDGGRHHTVRQAGLPPLRASGLSGRQRRLGRGHPRRALTVR